MSSAENSKSPATGEDGRLVVAETIAACVSNENGENGENGYVAVRPNDGNLPVYRVFPWA